MPFKVKEKKERTLGTKLFIKAERCNSPKCVMVRKPYRPGVHGQKRHSVSDYGRQLQEKQKIGVIYGLNNRQLQNLFREAGEKVLVILERRLDRVVFYLGLARSPRVARQLVGHGHILVNGRKVTISSYQVRVGDVVSIRAESKNQKIFEDMLAKSKQYNPPVWLKLNREDFSGECLSMPKFEEVNLPFDIDLVGQFYSR